FYKATGFTGNVSVKLDSNKGDNKGCSSTISFILPDGSELFGASDGTCPDAVTEAADANGAILLDCEGDLVPTVGIILNPSGTGATTGEGEGEGEGAAAKHCNQQTDCGADQTCNAQGVCEGGASSCTNNATGGPTPWWSVALVAGALALTFGRAGRSCRTASGSR